MKQKLLILLLVLCATALCGCASSAPAPEATETLPPLDVPQVEAQGAAARAARAMLAPYDDQLQKIADAGTGNISYTIPGSLLDKMTADAETMNVSPEGGCYRFTWRQSGDYTYSVSAQDVQAALASEEAEASPTPESDTPRSDSYLGDDTTLGGGSIDRAYVYDTAADFSEGRIEITETLNGETTGNEIFTFVKRGDVLYFTDAAPLLTADLDALEISDEFLVVIGRFEKNRVEIIEYQAPAANIPDAASMDFDALAASVRPVTHLVAQGNSVTVTP